MRLFTLTLTCADQVGIVHAITGVLVRYHCNIVDSSQFDDHAAKQFYMRVSFAAPDALDQRRLERDLRDVAQTFGIDWRLFDRSVSTRVMLMVSKFDHCLLDLLYRMEIGELKIEVPVIVSNHADAAKIAERHKIEFVHLPITPETKAAQETKLLDLVKSHEIELVVLARYMQILSENLCRKLDQKAINIHHSFLPGFKGAKPYQQAHARGVKLIGATAHFVTADLDEGPIIEQDVARVRHDHSAGDLVAIGRDIERVVLARAVSAFADRRILLSGSKTIVFN